jgi:hypothetical protein
MASNGWIFMKDVEICDMVYVKYLPEGTKDNCKDWSEGNGPEHLTQGFLNTERVNVVR